MRACEHMTRQEVRDGLPLRGRPPALWTLYTVGVLSIILDTLESGRLISNRVYLALDAGFGLLFWILFSICVRVQYARTSQLTPSPIWRYPRITLLSFLTLPTSLFVGGPALVSLSAASRNGDRNTSLTTILVWWLLQWILAVGTPIALLVPRINLALPMQFVSAGITVYTIAVVKCLRRDHELAVRGGPSIWTPVGLSVSERRACAAMLALVTFTIVGLGATLRTALKESNLIGWASILIAGPLAYRVSQYATQRANTNVPPILLLRSFQDDDIQTFRGIGIVRHLEDALLEASRSCGPLIALGRNPWYPTNAGASRLYVDDSLWKSEIVRLIEESQCIIVVLGGTENLNWELAHIFNLGHGNKTMVVVPPKMPSRERYAGIVASFHNFGVNLPAFNEMCRAIVLMVEDTEIVSIAARRTGTNYVRKVRDCLVRIARQRERSSVA
jgi:hypothetical protein